MKEMVRTGLFLFAVLFVVKTVIAGETEDFTAYYPGAVLDTFNTKRLCEDVLENRVGDFFMDYEVYLTEDSFKKVVRYYKTKGNIAEFSPFGSNKPIKRENLPDLKRAFVILDSAQDIGSSRRFIGIDSSTFTDEGFLNKRSIVIYKRVDGKSDICGCLKAMGKDWISQTVETNNESSESHNN